MIAKGVIGDEAAATPVEELKHLTFQTGQTEWASLIEDEIVQYR